MNIARPAAFPSYPLPEMSMASGVPAESAACAAANPGTADLPVHGPFLPASACLVGLSNAPLSILSGYLEQQDRLTLRQVDAAARTAVDTLIHTLTLSGRQACATLNQPGALHNLKTLRLTNCQNADLVDLAEVLRSVPHPPFELVLARDAGTHVTARGLQAIAAARLSGLSLQGIPIPPDAAQALSHGGFPVSMALPHRADGMTDVDRISRIPTLTSLDGGGQPVSDTAIRALRSHAALRELGLATLTGRALRELAGGATLRALAVNAVRGDEAEAYAALAGNRVLTSLTIRRVTDARHVMALAANSTLSSLSLGVGHGLGPSVRALAGMPSLTDLVLGPSGTGLTGADVQALCTKPLQSLSFVGLRMDSSALAFAVTSRCRSLTVEFCGVFTGLQAVLLAANPWLSSVCVTNGILHESAALRLAGGPALKRLTMNFNSRTPDASGDRVKRAWVAAGKQLADIDLVVHPVPEREAPPFSYA
ncbi:MAG: hypothetical protein ACRYHA_27325 [Janthinobacterium lividum]